ncbi:MAG: nitrile hydratase subunit beta [Salinisphaera sp.]|jgi:hypothetical protein|nr:nitrile hydratase subunit beta [Salinisphaera sp.]
MPRLEPKDLHEVVRRGTRAKVDVPIEARFAEGDAVRTRNIHPTGHTRLPRYARDKTGIIDRDHGVFVFPDTHAHGDARPQHCYSVRFPSDMLWGAAGEVGTQIYIDLWDDHLEST